MHKMRAQINPQGKLIHKFNLNVKIDFISILKRLFISLFPPFLEIESKHAPTIEVQEFDVASSEPMGELVPEPAVMASRNGKQSVRVTGSKSRLLIDQSTPTPK